MPRAEGTRRRRAAFGLVVTLVTSLASIGACGSRTSLETEGSASSDGGPGGGTDLHVGAGGAGGAPAGAGGASPGGCPRPDLPARLVLERSMLEMGNVATDGCSFAATWLGHEPGRIVIAVTTFRVVDGAWQAASTTTVGVAGATINSPRIAWDGEAYVVAWADAVLRLRRIAPDGAPLGPAATSFDAPGIVYLRWLQAETDGSLRVGFTGRGTADREDIHVARVTADGAVVAPPRALGANPVAETVGFVAAPDATTALWTAPESGAMTLLRARFDDAGALLAPPEALIVDQNLLTSRSGVAVAGGETYVGVLRNDPPGLAVGRLTPSGHVPVEGVPGGDAPVLAATGRGALGVLTRRERGAPTSPLELTTLDGGAVGATEVLGEAWGSDKWGMAGGDETFGIVWASSDSSVTFATVAP